MMAKELKEANWPRSLNLFTRQRLKELAWGWPFPKESSKHMTGGSLPTIHQTIPGHDLSSNCPVCGTWMNNETGCGLGIQVVRDMATFLAPTLEFHRLSADFGSVMCDFAHIPDQTIHRPMTGSKKTCFQRVSCIVLRNFIFGIPIALSPS